MIRTPLRISDFFDSPKQNQGKIGISQPIEYKSIDQSHVYLQWRDKRYGKYNHRVEHSGY